MAKIDVSYDDPRLSFLQDAGGKVTKWGDEAATLEIQIYDLQNFVADLIGKLPPEALFLGWTSSRVFKFGREANVKSYGGFFEPDLPVEFPKVLDLGEVAAHNLNYALGLAYEDVSEGGFVQLVRVGESIALREGSETETLGLVVEFEGSFTLQIHQEIIFLVDLKIHHYPVDSHWGRTHTPIREVNVRRWDNG